MVSFHFTSSGMSWKGPTGKTSDSLAMEWTEGIGMIRAVGAPVGRITAWAYDAKFTACTRKTVDVSCLEKQPSKIPHCTNTMKSFRLLRFGGGTTVLTRKGPRGGPYTENKSSCGSAARCNPPNDLATKVSSVA